MEKIIILLVVPNETTLPFFPCTASYCQTFLKKCNNQTTTSQALYYQTSSLMNFCYFAIEKDLPQLSDKVFSLNQGHPCMVYHFLIFQYPQDMFHSSDSSTGYCLDPVRYFIVCVATGSII